VPTVHCRVPSSGVSSVTASSVTDVSVSIVTSGLLAGPPFGLDYDLNVPRSMDAQTLRGHKRMAQKHYNGITGMLQPHYNPYHPFYLCDGDDDDEQGIERMF
jgi:hypothetical protein